jgi:acetyltransferase/esterase
MTTTSRPEGELIDIGGAQLYVERRGHGPALLFIPGGGMDATHFMVVADLLAEDFSTVVYDRRGYHRSPAPPGWTATTIGEQVDDVAGLIRELALAPAAVWGGSLGGIVLLELIRRHPSLVRAALVHEPPLFTVLGDERELRNHLAALAERARRDGARRVMTDHAEAELGDAFARLDATARHRMQDNAETFLLIDVPGLACSLPPPDTLVSSVPTVVLRSPENSGTPPGRAAGQLAQRLGVPLEHTPGGHLPYVTEPQATAATIRSLLHRLTP